METEINYITFDAILRKKEDTKWVLFLQLDPSLEIDLSATEQDYLKNVFNSLIKKMIVSPFYFAFKKSDEDDAKGLNEVCEKYISILNNDLKGVYEEYQKDFDEITNDNKK